MFNNNQHIFDQQINQRNALIASKMFLKLASQVGVGG